MKRIINSTLALLAALLLAGPAAAQTYRVASVNGEASCLRSGSWSALSPRETLSSTDVVRIGERSVLSVIDREESKLYALKAQKEAPLLEIIRAQSRSALGRFAANFMRALTRGDTEKISHEANVSYKDLNADGAIYAAMADPAYRSARPVSMTLVDEQTGQEISGSAEIGRRFFFRVTNRASEPLFVNVLDVASDGSLYDCLPIDEGGTMLHLLVPAESTVDLRRYPMEFSEPAGTDRLILAAYDRPFDLRNVIKAFEAGKPADASPEGVGLFRTDLEVRNP